MLSKTTNYAIRALIYIQNHQDKNLYININDIAKNLDISFHFLTKILQTLTKNNVLVSLRGPAGGVALRKNPQQVLLIDIVNIFEGSDFFDHCLIGLPGCGKMEPCPVHNIWAAIKDDLKTEFENTSILNLKKLNARITHESLNLMN